MVVVPLHAQGRRVTIHPTACDGMYTCDKECDDIFYRVAKDGDKSACEAKVSLLHASGAPKRCGSCSACTLQRHLPAGTASQTGMCCHGAQRCRRRFRECAGQICHRAGVGRGS